MMRRRALYGVLLIMTVTGTGLRPLPASAGKVLDRIVATVNGQPILQSDWEDEVRYQAFLQGNAGGQADPEEQKAALDRLIDQELLREQLRLTQTPPVAEAEIARRLAEVRRLYAGAEKDETWQALLQQAGVSESGLRRRLALQVELTQLVDRRLRPAVQVDARSIESYYNQELLPQLRKAGAQDVALQDVTPKIKEVLTEKKLSQLLVAWLQTLRASSSIRSSATDDPAAFEPK